MVGMRQMERVQVRLPKDRARRLRDLAGQRGISVAALVREAVDRSLSEPLHTVTLDERWRRSLAVKGRYRSKSTEPAGTEHDRYLEEIYRS